MNEITSDCLLSIVIPTYNRNDKVLRTINFLLPQSNIPKIEIIVVDNCSDTPVFDTLSENLTSDEMRKIKIYRNSFNLGMSGNFLRCFEVAKGEYIWLLGDDDVIKPNAIATIFEDILENNNLVYINYSVEKMKMRQKELVCIGLMDFVERIDHLGILIFISTSIFNRKKLIENVKLGYQFGQSLAPHMVMLLHSIEEKDKCLLREKSIVDWDFGTDNWSIMPFLLGFPSILDSLTEERVRQIIGKRISEMFHPRDVIIAVLQTENPLYFYSQTSSKLYYYASLKVKFIWLFISISLIFPSSSLMLLKLYCELRGAPFKLSRNSFERV